MFRPKPFDNFPPEGGCSEGLDAFRFSGINAVPHNKHLIIKAKECSLSMEMNRLTRDGTAEPVSRDQILMREREQGKNNVPCSADHEKDWQPYPVDPYLPLVYVMTIYRVLRKGRVCIYGHHIKQGCGYQSCSWSAEQGK